MRVRVDARAVAHDALPELGQHDLLQIRAFDDTSEGHAPVGGRRLQVEHRIPLAANSVLDSVRQIASPSGLGLDLVVQLSVQLLQVHHRVRCELDGASETLESGSLLDHCNFDPRHVPERVGQREATNTGTRDQHMQGLLIRDLVRCDCDLCRGSRNCCEATVQGRAKAVRRADEVRRRLPPCEPRPGHVQQQGRGTCNSTDAGQAAATPSRAADVHRQLHLCWRMNGGARV
mmetsp:Transcript_142282/g.454862  ORF Transcript_142282/g.454862 Transcript_142282/m.454862 type:complete len:232 (-) Transcript_142282:22-717(-)